MGQEVIFKIFPMADPDGVARNGVRFNAHGYDLNRNGDAVAPNKMPEIAAQRKAILDWVDAGRRIDLFLTLHNTETAEYVEGPPAPVVEHLYHALVEMTTFAPRARPASSKLPPRGQSRPHERCPRALPRAQNSGDGHGADELSEPQAGTFSHGPRPARVRRGTGARGVEGGYPLVCGNLPPVEATNASS